MYFFKFLILIIYDTFITNNNIIIHDPMLANFL